MEDKIMNLAKKLYELSERGVDGEKENAMLRLEHIMRKYGITLDMLIENQKKRRDVKLEEDSIRFFSQVIASVAGRIDIYGIKGEANKKKKTIVFDCSETDYIEIMQKFDFYYKKYKEDLAIFYSAFVQKNHLYVKDSARYEEMTAEELQRIKKVVGVMSGLDRHHLTKQIENGV